LAKTLLILKDESLMPPTPQNENYRTCPNNNLQKLIILEDLSQNGLHHLIQRTLLRRIALVENTFGDVFFGIAISQHYNH